ncbi:GNAT family N-acetyltransferase [Nakamurella deserti]|uniref:GNAT family N-acetyltransferase n=1 Tax=Nakamurella deserti TaxID=2164074 RepID=UPI000DBE70F2|nr:GNAT family N-acetyltransferase [Nakamurella deserti]
MNGAWRVEVVHTADLGSIRRSAVRALLYEVFDDMTEPDWEHCLGGVHALTVADGGIVAHAALVARRLGHRGRPLRAGYVEGVAVRPDRQRQGLGSAVMAPLERMIVDAYEVGALAATDDGARFYTARGWRSWAGRTWSLTPDGAVRTPDDDDCVFVWPGASEPLDLTGDLLADWRDDCAW